MTEQVQILTEKEAIDRLQSLQEQEKKLNEDSIRMKTEYLAVVKNLDQLKTEAREKFGTDSLEELRGLYRKKMEENTNNILSFSQKLSDAQKIINDAKQRLAEIEQGAV